jgi:hypothetical protein
VEAGIPIAGIPVGWAPIVVPAGVWIAPPPAVQWAVAPPVPSPIVVVVPVVVVIVVVVIVVVVIVVIVVVVPAVRGHADPETDPERCPKTDVEPRRIDGSRTPVGGGKAESHTVEQP